MKTILRTSLDVCSSALPRCGAMADAARGPRPLLRALEKSLDERIHAALGR